MKNTTLESVGIVFLHGAGLGAWIWEDVIKKASYPCLAIDFPGRGKHSSITTNNLTLNNYVESVLADIDPFCHKKIIIVAHSISGVIGLEVSSKLKDRICGFIAISACIPSANRSYISSMPLVMNLFLRLLFKFSGTRPPETALRNALCNDLEENQTLNVIKRFVPESTCLYTDRIHAQNVPENSIYVHLKKDKAFSESMQKKMIANLHAKQVIDIESGHLPMLSKPDEIANILNHFAAQVNN
ncbi:MAG: alpha/beta hydrolase [Desulfobacteraceae bacterium]|nr:MAG: alpha/beta hydrolase [Desulfobacteraceae bacterium]